MSSVEVRWVCTVKIIIYLYHNPILVLLSYYWWDCLLPLSVRQCIKMMLIIAPWHWDYGARILQIFALVGFIMHLGKQLSGETHLNLRVSNVFIKYN